MIEYADVIVDCQAGDTGKGKVAHHLVRHGKYDFVLRYNGGGNAGHTIYHNGVKIITHQVPVGVLFGVKSIIGPGCVVNFQKLREEITMLHDHGIDTSDTLLIDRRAHVTLPSHILEDSGDITLGTTKQGIGPTYRDKYARKGVRAADVVKFNTPNLGYQIVDVTKLFHNTGESVRLLGEGAQGYQLDIDFGDYPYVTTSHCTAGSICLNGISPKDIRKVYGTAKAYETYSGFKDTFEPDNARILISRIREIGCEIGATTGRPRKIRWLHIAPLCEAMNVNGVTDLIISKIDVLQDVGKFPLVLDGTEVWFEDIESFKWAVETEIKKRTRVESITWSHVKEGV